METAILILVIINLVLNVVIVSISSTWMLFNKNNKEEKVEKRNDIHYRRNKQYCKKIIINGVEYNSEKEASEKLNIPRSTLSKWHEIYTQEALDKKVDIYLNNNNNIEDKEKEKSNDIAPKRKRNAVGKLKITPNIPPYIAVKYNLKVGDEFQDKKGFVEYTGGSGSLPNMWIKRKWLENVK